MADVPAVLTIHERDITSDVCRRCARCCEVDIALPGTNSRYRRFLRAIGYRLSPPAAEGQADCCDKVHDATLHLGPCQHLKSETVAGEVLHSCGLYGDPRRPQLCDEYNCVSWAKAQDSYKLTNPHLAAAQHAWQRVRFVAPAGVLT